VNYFDDAAKKGIENGGIVLPKESTKERNVTLNVEKKTYSILLSLHGDYENHYANYKKSYKGEFTEVEDEIFYNNFRLLEPHDRGYLSPFVSTYISKLLNLPSVEQDMVFVTINGDSHGIYYMEEQYNEDFLEKNGYPNMVIIKYDNLAIKNSGKISNNDFTGLDPYFYDVKSLDKINHPKSAEITERMQQFFSALQSKNEDQIFKYLDIDNLAKFEAWRSFLGKTHDINGINRRYIYNLSNGKIFILPRLESEIRLLVDKDGNWDINKQDPLFDALYKNKTFLKKRDNELRKILKNKENILEYYDKIEKLYAPTIIADQTIVRPYRERKFDMTRHKTVLQNNLNFIEKIVYNDNYNINDNKVQNKFPETLQINSLIFRQTFENNYVLINKNLYIYEDIVIPSGYIINIPKGSVIRLSSQSSLVSYSPINFNGTQDDKIVITSRQNNAPFGVIAINGFDQSGCSISVENLNIYNGSEDFVDGVYYSGALNSYYCSVDMSETDVHNNHADDGLNVKFASVDIKNSSFRGNYADQIDLDFVTGTVHDNTFYGGDDANGDGLDLSGSNIYAFENSFISFNDKAISVGEKSKINIQKNTFTSNEKAIEIKDSSQAVVHENIYKENKLDINLYKKKIIFEGGHLFLMDDSLDVLNISLDKFSSYKYLEKKKFLDLIKNNFLLTH